MGGVDPRSAVTLTFLFTDLEGSTRLWERFPDAMKGALGRHDGLDELPDVLLRRVVAGANVRVGKEKHLPRLGCCRLGHRRLLRRNRATTKRGHSKTRRN